MSYAGAGAYADFRGDAATLNATRLKQMNFGINWDAVFPYPYHGTIMLVPVPSCLYPYHHACIILPSMLWRTHGGV